MCRSSLPETVREQSAPVALLAQIPDRTRRNSIMRKIIVLEHITLDGVIQAPGGPDEDRSDGFAYGGWAAPYHDRDEAIETALNKMLNMPLDLLLGRKTFELWAAFWPQHGDIWPAANTATKYIASNTVTSSEWQPSVFLNGDIAEKVAKLKEEQGPDLNVWGSGNLLQTLMKNRRDLILSLGLLLAVALACKGGFTTANISSLKIASDEAGNNETKTFKPGDKVYAVAQISNNVGKVHAKFRVLYDDVQGQTAGTLVPGAEKTLDVE